MAQLPPFKPSGAGAQKDLERILKAQMLSWGQFKGRFKEYYSQAARTTTINGNLCYDKMDITWGIDQPNSPQGKFLDLIGFTKENLQELVDIRDNGDNKIESIFFTFTNWQNYDRKSMSGINEVFLDMLSGPYGIDEVVIDLRNSAYKKGTTPTWNKTIRDYGVQYWTESNAIAANEYYVVSDAGTWIGCNKEKQNNYTKIGDQVLLNAFRIVENCIIRTYKNGRENSSYYSEATKRLLATWIMLERSMITEKYRYTYEVDWYADTTYIERVTQVKYDMTKLDNDVLIDHGYSYATYASTGGPTCNYISNFWFAMWDERGRSIGRLSNFAFDSKDVAFGMRNNYMLIDGIDKMRMDMFGYMMSETMKIEFKQDKGSKLERFIGGLIRAFVKMFDALIGLMLKIPIMKQLVTILINAIANIFGLNFEQAQMVLGKILMAVFMIGLSALVSPMIFGEVGSIASSSILPGMDASLATMLTVTSDAMDIYSTATQAAMQGRRIMDQEREKQEDRRKRDWEYDHPDPMKAFLASTHSPDQSDRQNEMMYNLMFNPMYIFQQAVKPKQIESGIQQF